MKQYLDLMKDILDSGTSKEDRTGTGVYSLFAKQMRFDAVLFEEVGDIFWYLAIIADELQFSFDDVMERNLEKLKARYGDKFTKDKAINRNLEKELDVLK